MRKACLGVLLAAAALVMIAAVPARAGEAPVYTGFLSSLAVNGYDPVAYFTDGGPVEGSPAFESTYRGATWRFASAANKATFDADPAAFAPQYGGYCAWAVSQGYTAKGDPANWRIVDGKLYLNYNAAVQQNWEKDVAGNITAADANWPKVLK
ncbi:YHS domain-containing (seleno)protein [Thalassobaculum sp.]|uniref:YHS domain-containing (seleno)protein n=1 Tax=Thalassobaculum sp. TaxID=2022740 RepID=UPI0032EC1961